MKNNKNNKAKLFSGKKGVSAVVATVLIILITIAAISIIWAAIIPMIKTGLEGSDKCMNAQAEVSIGPGYTCINTTNVGGTAGGSINLQIKHGPSSFTLGGLRVLVHIGGNSYPIELNSSYMPGPNGEKVIRGINGTSVAQNFSKATKIEIAPIINIGSTRKECDIAQSYELSRCS